MLTAMRGVVKTLRSVLPQLIAVYLLGALVHDAFVALAAKLTPVNPLLSAVILPLALLGQLGSLIGMLLLMRPAIPYTAPTPDGRPAQQSLAESLTSAVLPFVAFYTVWNYITNDYADFQFAAFANSWRVEDNGAVTSAPIRIAVTATVIATAAVVFIIRTVLRRNRKRLPRWTLALEYYLEALWVYLLIANWLSDVNLKNWLQTRRFVAWFADERAHLMDGLGPVTWLWDTSAWLIGQLAAVFAVPLGWLAIVGVVYALTPDITWERTAKAILGDRADRVPGTRHKDAVSIVEYPFRAQLTAFRDAVYVIFHVGVLPMATYVFAFTCLTWFYGSRTDSPAKPGWLIRFISERLGPHELGWWNGVLDALSIVPTMSYNILLVCLVVTVYAVFAGNANRTFIAEPASPTGDQ